MLRHCNAQPNGNESFDRDARTGSLRIAGTLFVESVEQDRDGPSRYPDVVRPTAFAKSHATRSPGPRLLRWLDAGQGGPHIYSMTPLFRPRSLSNRARQRRCSVLAQHARSCPPRGALGLSPLLACRTPQQSRHCQRCDRHRDRSCRCEHFHHSGRMLLNHAPLVVAEQFGTLSCLFPKRSGSLSPFSASPPERP